MKRTLSIVLALTIALSLMTAIPLTASASCPFAALTGTYEVVTSKGYSGQPADTFGVGEAFENIVATIGYNYKGMNAAHYGRNHKWWMNGMPIEQGYVFNQVGRYTMTLQCEMSETEYDNWAKKGVKLPSRTAVASYQFSVLPNIDWGSIREFTLTSTMAKTTYRQGADEFDPTSIIIRAGMGSYQMEGDAQVLKIDSYQDLDWDDLTYYAGARGMKYKENGAQITKGYRFWVPGEKDLWVVVANHHIVIPFTVTPFVSSVELNGAPTMTEGSTIRTGDFSVRANYNDGTSGVLGGDSLGISINGQRMYKGGEYKVPSGTPTVSVSMGDFTLKGNASELVGKRASLVGIIAKPTNTKFMLNGAEVALPAYEIGGNNYVKLRDVAALLKTRFDVRWEDNKAKLIPFAVYTSVGGELDAIGTESKSATVSTTEFALYDKWGELVGKMTPTAYAINGNNFIKLRDIAQMFDFDVDWRDNKAWIEPDVSPYTED